MRWLLGLIHFALIVWAVLSIVGSNATTGAKVLWALGVIIFPVVGFVVWFLAGPKSA